MSLHQGYQVFLGPEVFFSPGIISDKVIDNTIQLSPIDYIRKLYSNIIITGGSTLFYGFAQRLQRTIQERVDKRLKANETEDFRPGPVDVHVTHAAWLGGSTVASDLMLQV